MLSICWIALVTLHVLVANISATVPLYAIWLDWWEVACKYPSAGDFSGRLILNSLYAVLLAIAIGLVMLFFPIHASQTSPWEFFGTLPSGVRMNFVGEIAFHLVLVGAALWLWRRPHPSRANRVVRRVLALLAATNLLYHFPLFFTALASLANSGVLPTGGIDAAAWRGIRFSQAVLPLALHHWLAAVAAGGSAVVYWSTCSKNDANTSAARSGAIPALAATMLQIPSGIYLVTSLPNPWQEKLMGQSALASGFFLIGILAAVFLMHQLAKACRGDLQRRHATMLVGNLALVTALMTATLFLLRSQS